MRTHSVVLIFAFLFLIASLAGCSAHTVPPEERFVIFCNNDTATDIAAIQIDFSLGGDTLGSVVGSYADGTPIKPGDAMDFEFLPEDFPEHADLSQLQIGLTVRDMEGSEKTARTPVNIGAAYGEFYQISITGNAADGYDAQLMEVTYGRE